MTLDDSRSRHPSGLRRRDLMADLRRVNRQLALYHAEPELTEEQADECGIDELKVLVDESWHRLDQLINSV